MIIAHSFVSNCQRASFESADHPGSREKPLSEVRINHIATCIGSRVKVCAQWRMSLDPWWVASDCSKVVIMV